MALASRSNDFSTRFAAAPFRVLMHHATQHAQPTALKSTSCRSNGKSRSLGEAANSFSKPTTALPNTSAVSGACTSSQYRRTRATVHVTASAVVGAGRRETRPPSPSRRNVFGFGDEEEDCACMFAPIRAMKASTDVSPSSRMDPSGTPESISIHFAKCKRSFERKKVVTVGK